MIGPTLAVKLGEKGPPFIKGWQELPGDELERQCAIYDFANQGLRLDHYLALDPDDQAASELLENLDRDGKLPATVSWKTWRGMTIRIYKRQNGLLPHKPTKSPKLEIRTSAGQYVLIPPSRHKDGQYQWINSPEDIEVADLPPDTLSLVLKASNSSTNTIATPMPSFDKWVELWEGVGSGYLHDATIKLAGRLLGRGLPEREVIEILMAWNYRNSPPSDPKMLIKRVQGIDRAELKKQTEAERSLSEEIREWALTTSGNFMTTDLYRDLDLTTRDNKKKAVVTLLRMEKDGLLSKCGKRRGCYRLIEADSPIIDFINADISQVYDLRFPFDLQNYVNIYPKNVIVIAGASNAGKTAFLLNVVKMNMDRHKIEYFSSEMGPEEMKLRLLKFDDLRLKDWKFHPRERSTNFADAIVPDSINIIDYLEVNKDFYEVGGEIKGIFERLNKGLAIIALQKKTGVDTGRGGEFTLEKPRLYLAMDSGTIKIVKGKNWANNEINPNTLSWTFKLVGGARFIETGGSLYDL